MFYLQWNTYFTYLSKWKKNRITVKSNWKSDCGLIRIYPVSVNVYVICARCDWWNVQSAQTRRSRPITRWFFHNLAVTPPAVLKWQRCDASVSSGRSITVIRDDLQTINDWKCDCQCDLCSVTATKWIIYGAIQVSLHNDLMNKRQTSMTRVNQWKLLFNSTHCLFVFTTKH